MLVGMLALSSARGLMGCMVRQAHILTSMLISRDCGGRSRVQPPDTESG